MQRLRALATFRPATDRRERGEHVAGPQGQRVDTTLTFWGNPVLA